MVTYTKDAWMLGIMSYSQWETSNRLVANSEMDCADKLEKVLKEMKDTIKTLTNKIKAAKIPAVFAVTKADKALAKKG
eukprot:5655604-Ditylum_brightwellii.AAC.1